MNNKLRVTDIIQRMELRFKSGNEIPVERASITAEEWNTLKTDMDEIVSELEECYGKIDAMPEQIEEWGRHQIRTSPEEEARINEAIQSFTAEREQK